MPKLVDNLSGGKPFQDTTVEFWRDGDTAHFIFNVIDNNIVAVGERYNDDLFHGDVVELMTGDLHEYLEIEVNPNGVLYSAIIRNRDGRDDFTIEKIPQADCPFTAKTERTATGWTTQIRLATSHLGKLFNLYRQDFLPDGTLRLSALSPTKEPKFHRPNRFVELCVNGLDKS